jgi:hypothetical protein
MRADKLTVKTTNMTDDTDKRFVTDAQIVKINSVNPSTQLLTASVNLTNDQIKALYTTPIEIVAAQGANTVIQVIAASLALDNANGLYSGGGNIVLRLGANTVCTPTTNSFFNGNASSSKLSYNSGISQNPTPAATNIALTVTNLSAVFTGGYSSNKATIAVQYIVTSSLPA